MIAESDIIQDFLTESEEDITSSPLVELKVMVMNEQIVSIKTKRNATATEVYKLVVQKIGLLPENWEFFALFEIVEHNFERKVQPGDFPHSLYIANYSTAAATCLAVRKWLFHPRVEAELEADSTALAMLFHQAVEEVGRGQVMCPNSKVSLLSLLFAQVQTKDKLHHLKSMQESGKMAGYLSTVREMDGYGAIGKKI